MLRRYVDNVPPVGSKLDGGESWQQIRDYCKTAWNDMQRDGIRAERCWVLESMEPDELIAVNYVIDRD
jgi:hypothetical protein